MHALEPALRAGLAALGLALTDGQVAQLLAYQDLLQKWNRVYNLTAVRDPQQMLHQHLLDSLALVVPLRRHIAQLPEAAMPLRVLDVGSGGGLPGVVLAIACPELAVDCVDTVAKKAAFIQQVAAQLRLGTLRGIHARVESLTDPYAVIVCRAFAALADFVQWSQCALSEHGVWLAMKGAPPADELAALPASVQMFHVEPLSVPGLDAQRCLVWMRRA